MADQLLKQVPSWPDQADSDGIYKIYYRLTFEPKVQITQSNNLLKNIIVSMYHVTVNSCQTFVPVFRKQIVKIVAFWFTYAVLQ